MDFHSSLIQSPPTICRWETKTQSEEVIYPGHTAIGGKLGFKPMSSGVTDMSECQDLMKCLVNGSFLPLSLGHGFQMVESCFK